jgi:hypothetical protein
MDIHRFDEFYSLLFVQNDKHLLQIQIPLLFGYTREQGSGQYTLLTTSKVRKSVKNRENQT